MNIKRTIEKLIVLTIVFFVLFCCEAKQTEETSLADIDAIAGVWYNEDTLKNIQDDRIIDSENGKRMAESFFDSGAIRISKQKNGKIVYESVIAYLGGYYFFPNITPRVNGDEINLEYISPSNGEKLIVFVLQLASKDKLCIKRYLKTGYQACFKKVENDPLPGMWLYGTKDQARPNDPAAYQ